MTAHGNTSTEREMDKYIVKIGGADWRFNGTLWKVGCNIAAYLTPFAPARQLTPAELRAIADVQERWERDHKPKRQVRLRLVQEESLDGGATWTPTHEGPTDA